MPTPATVVDLLYALLPSTMTREDLEAYGLAVTPEQAQRITQEVLALSLFWMANAIRCLLSGAEEEQVLAELRRRLRGEWETRWALEGHDPDRFFAEAAERQRAFQAVVDAGGPPVAVFSETAELLEAQRVTWPEDRPKVLALLVEHVPVDEIGACVEELDQR
jgi:hypothetical protein